MTRPSYSTPEVESGQTGEYLSFSRVVYETRLTQIALLSHANFSGSNLVGSDSGQVGLFGQQKLANLILTLLLIRLTFIFSYLRASNHLGWTNLSGPKEKLGKLSYNPSMQMLIMILIQLSYP